MVVVLTPVEQVEAYGIADMDSDGRILRFVEKPSRETAPSKMANTGIYLISSGIREVFEQPEVQKMINVNRRLDFGLDLIPYLVERHPVYGYQLQGDWEDVGTPRGYLNAVASVLRKRDRPWSYLGNPVPGLQDVLIQGMSPESIRRREDIVRSVLAGKITLDGSVLIGRHCQIGEGSTIRSSCIDNFCIIGKGVTIERSSIMDRVVVEDGAMIQDSIVGRHVRVGSSQAKPTWLTGLSVLGDDVNLGEGSVLISTKVNPHVSIPTGSSLEGRTVE
jgi:NDP-sugar pyrophosphorylase family protein